MADIFILSNHCKKKYPKNIFQIKLFSVIKSIDMKYRRKEQRENENKNFFLIK